MADSFCLAPEAALLLAKVKDVALILGTLVNFESNMTLGVPLNVGSIVDV